MSLDLELESSGDEGTGISQLVRPARQRGANVFAVFRENKLAMVGVVIIITIVLFCLLGPLMYHTNQISTNLINANDSPEVGHPLGTDNVGYDELGRLMVGGNRRW
jgi:ABC-type antimicrobial peptide transport system permease subunit